MNNSSRFSNPHTRHFVSALAKGLSVLKCFTKEKRWLANSEIASLTGLPKSSVSRIATTLSKLNYLHYDSYTKQYQLGVSTLPFALVTSWTDLVCDVAMPSLKRLADSTGGVAAIAIKSNLTIKYVLVARARGLIEPQIEVGTSILLGRTAAGLVCLATLPISSRHQVINELAEFEGGTRNLENAVQQSSEDVRDIGYCTTASPWSGDLITVAAPLAIHGLQDPPIIEWHGTESMEGLHTLSSKIGPHLQGIANQICSDIGP